MCPNAMYSKSSCLNFVCLNGLYSLCSSVPPSNEPCVINMFMSFGSSTFISSIFDYLQ